MKQKVYNLLYKNKLVIEFIYGLIIFNVIVLILESYQELRNVYGYFFHLVEIFSVIIFTVEYLLRIWVADIDLKFKKSRLRFIFSFYGLIDLIAILPFYLPMLLIMDLRVLRIIRLFRLLRIFKLGRYSKSMRMMNQVLKETRSDLLITLFVAFILLVISSTLMYYVESDAQPDKFASIGHSFWWAIATLTTVGYGDVYPITGLGKVLSAIIAMVGIGFVALPTGIISSAFIERIKHKNSKENIVCQCPNCGTKFEL